MVEDSAIRKYAGLMRELDLTGLEVTENGATVRLERTPGPVTVSAAAPAGAPAAAAPRAPLAAEAASAPESHEGVIEIRSPMVGVFYASATEDAAPFVKAGDSVKKGDVLCIIEAMKLMNEITAEQDGVIEEVCVGNNQVVDFDHILFRFRRA